MLIQRVRLTRVKFSNRPKVSLARPRITPECRNQFCDGIDFEYKTFIVIAIFKTAKFKVQLHQVKSYAAKCNYF